MLIGVDHGNKQIKTVHCNPFVSGLKQSVTRPFGQNVLRYQNTYYTLSTERIPYRKDKTEDDRFFILTLFALAGEIEARGAYSSEVQRIQLAVGLPPAHFGAQVERFTQYFGQRGMVEFDGTKVNENIEKPSLEAFGMTILAVMSYQTTPWEELAKKPSIRCWRKRQGKAAYKTWFQTGRQCILPFACWKPPRRR